MSHNQMVHTKQLHINSTLWEINYKLHSSLSTRVRTLFGWQIIFPNTFYYLLLEYDQLYLFVIFNFSIKQEAMQESRESLACNEEIVQPVLLNAVSCNSINELMKAEQYKKEGEEQLETNDQKIKHILLLAYGQLKESQFMDAIRIMNSHWKGVKTEKIDWKLKVCFFLNMACAYQGLWNLQMCDSTCEVAQTEINILIQQISEIQEKIRLQLMLVILRMQHCAIYSQMGSHQKALSTAQQNLKGLIQCLNDILLAGSKLDQKDPNKNNYGFVSFTSRMSRHLQLLKSLIKDLNQTVLVQNYDKRPIFYNWKNNPETNEKLIRQTFASQHIIAKDYQSRTLLGLQKQDNRWITEFNIGGIMHMTPIDFQELQKSHSIFDQLSKKKLYQKVIYASVLHFTTATQLRFIDSQNSQSTIASLKSKTELNYRSKTSQLSQLHHLKAIELMCKGISSKSPYLNHLINSYQKHYMQTLNCINEQQSMISEIKQSTETKEKDKQYFQEAEQNILSQPAQTPIIKKLKQVKSNDQRGTSKSVQFRKKNKSRQNSLKTLNTVFLKSPGKDKPDKKKPTKLALLKKAINSKNCELQMTTRSQTEIKFIMNRNKK